uniref:Uncharacterized protein n=1 Tax=Paramoeba aestuarina TaxID=180227 RepID=A0A7S4U5Y5_9EUKA|mmetsp:Transcript_34535/g.53902  ORF Transcript_34535/g.53902 Transcript_34535/m.53902 type:complete len:560 (+) Transcript_34535:41-1720(+)|eukprot:CAMPEP_0201521850 /NCGR_PEP_ID=MMETSP0161_2-20130828/16306_1 /ASSEMBLY_ACC=CAM_ASM_000251 /TAXON_ID=180227 /ORGANISM="Neoparamoeba aestuarina, Strain SoJaBio B1-5/56/2" /LENGTH=559 /DNA_ID=CAMNT_0047920565 /DNA_START=41 /DNA_END=1720 /DNA_ORIENTATION=+
MDKPDQDLLKNFDVSKKIDFGELTVDFSNPLGKGAFGTVYKGTCRGNDVAIKIPHTDGIKFDKDAFMKEIDIMTRSPNPHAVMLMGACVDKEGRICIVTELMEGEVTALSKKNDVSLSDRIDWCIQAAKGICWLHGSKILHRDIKPNNLLFDSHHKVKVTDFGLSQAIGGGIHYEESRGTPLYMAPEVFSPGSAPISPKSDVYSFAITMWEILTGKDSEPEGATPLSFIKGVLSGVRPEIPKNWGDTLIDLIKAMWDENPENRPDFQEIIQKLGKAKDEAVLEEFKETVSAAITNVHGFDFWVKHFFPKTTVHWDTFIKHYYDEIGKAVPEDPKDIRSGSPTDVYRSAQTQQLDRAKKRGDKKAEEEIARREKTGEGANFYLSDTDPSEYTIPQKEYHCLLLLLFTSSKNEQWMVDTVKFGKMLNNFGRHCSLEGAFNHVTNLCREDFFHGDIDGGKASNLLQNKPGGTFLVRFSGRHGVAISRVDMKHKVAHFVLTADQSGFKLKGPAFPTVGALVSAYREKYSLFTACPGSPFAYMFQADAGVAMCGYCQDDDDDDE